MIGEQIGNYVVRQQLGEGGMGAVYLAEHPQIGKRVALKVLHAELAANVDITTRFFHEAKAVNDIGHPNIVDILDFGSMTTERGPLVYLVMELLTGSTLTTVIEQGAIDPQRTVRIALQIADALAASHAKGIVHRDLKPDNIMLVARGRDEQVKLLDFGIAKMTAGTTSTKTRTGMVMGTPRYMSPEQCEGRGNIDHRTDIYALGIVLYEMLTGRLPFNGSGYGEILVKQMTEAPVPLSTVRPGISPHLEQIVLKALQKRPEERFATMEELASALAQPERYVDAHGGRQGFLPASPITAASPTASTVMLDATPPVKTHPTTLSYSAGQATGAPATGSQIAAPAAVGRNKTLLAIGGIAVVALVGGIGFIALHTKGSSDAAVGPTAAVEPTGSGTTVAPSPSASPTITPRPATAPAATAPVMNSVVPARKTIRLTVDTTPAGATIFVDGDNKPRCVSPCDVEVQRSANDTHLTVKLAGFKDEQRTIRLDSDQHLALDLENKPAPAQHHATTPAKPLPQPIGDNTLNPFDN